MDPDGNGVTSGVAFTKSNHLVFAKGNIVFSKYGEIVSKTELSENVEGPITSSNLYADVVLLSKNSSFSAFNIPTGEEIFNFKTNYRPWKVQDYIKDAESSSSYSNSNSAYLFLVGETNAVHLYELTENYFN